MKTCAAFFFLMMLFLTAQPLIIRCCQQQGKTKDELTSCCKKTCSSQQKKKIPEEKSNHDMACNPFAACSQCHYVATLKIIHTQIINANTDRKTLHGNDDARSGYRSDCWHPPKFVYLQTA